MRWRSGLRVIKDPDDVKDWFWDWSDWLSSGDSIASKAVSADPGITVDSSEIQDDGVAVVLSGGTAGTTYDVSVKITTTNGFVDQKTVSFEVTEQ